MNLSVLSLDDKAMEEIWVYRVLKENSIHIFSH